MLLVSFMWYCSFHDILTKNGFFIFLGEIHRDICAVYFNIFYHWVGSPFEYFELPCQWQCGSGCDVMASPSENPAYHSHASCKRFVQSTPKCHLPVQAPLLKWESFSSFARRGIVDILITIQRTKGLRMKPAVSTAITGRPWNRLKPTQIQNRYYSNDTVTP